MTGSRGVNSFMYWRPNLAKDSPDTAKNVIFRGGTITRPHRNNLRIAKNLIYF